MYMSYLSIFHYLAIVYYLADFTTNLLKIKPIKKQNIIACMLFGLAGETGGFHTKAL